MVNRKYSRLALIEDSKNRKRAVKFTLLTIVLITALIIFGIPAIAKFAGFLGDFKKSSTPAEKNDTTPPAPPFIDSVPESTNSAFIRISGNTESGATVYLTFNDTSQEQVANSSGEFSFDLDLTKGSNLLYAKVKDQAGNEGQASKTYTVTYDTEPPKLEIESPQDGQSFFGSRQRQLIIKGQTESRAKVIINERLVVVDENGSFLFTTTLSEGSNPFNIKTEDEAGNSTEKTLGITFSL